MSTLAITGAVPVALSSLRADDTEMLLDKWATIETELRGAGLRQDSDYELLFEAAWRLKMDAPAKAWPGLLRLLVAAEASQAGDAGDDVADGPVARLLQTAEFILEPFCDLRAPRRQGAFQGLGMSRLLREQLVRMTEPMLTRRDAPVFIPLLTAVRARHVDVGQSYQEIADACNQVLAMPRLLTERDRRQVRWVAAQVYRFWLTPGEAARHLVDRLVTPYCNAEVERWRAVMRNTRRCRLERTGSAT